MASSRFGVKILTSIITCACLLLLPGLPAQVAIAKTAEGSDEGKIATSISTISPDTLSYKEDAAPENEKITVQGQVTNSSHSALSEVNVQVLAGSRLVTSAASIRDWIQGDSIGGMGRFYLAGKKNIGNIKAGNKVSFQIEIPVSVLPTASQNKLGALGIQALASTNKVKLADSVPGRSLLLYAPASKSEAKTDLAVFAPISASSPEVAKWLATGGAGTNVTAGDPGNLPKPKALSTAKENLKILNNVSATGITWVVDPALLQADSPLLTGRFVPLPEKPAPASLDPAMLTALKTAQSKGASLSLDLWGAPDLVQLDEDGLARAAKWNRQVGALIGKQLELAPSSIFLADPHWITRANSICEDKSTQLTAGCVFFTGADRLALTRNYNYQPDLLAKLHLGEKNRTLLADYGDLSGLLADDSLAEAFTNTQLARALLAAITSERPAQPRLINAVLPNGAAANAISQKRLAKVLSDPWVNPLPLAKALAAESTSVELAEKQNANTLASSPSSSLGVAGSSYRNRTQALNQERNQLLSSLQQITQSTERITTPINQQLLIATSRAMTAAERNQAITNAGKQLEIVSRSVQIQSSSRINLIATNSQIPIKVINRLPLQVNVRLQLRPTDSRLRAKSSVVVNLAPKGSTTVKIPVTAVRNGNVRAYVAILPQQGNLVLGDQQRINLRIRSGWEDSIFLGFTATTAVVFLVGLVINFRRGTRMKRQ
ncbi:DUF6049 family protein [Varibaculum prostatecancerukia]|uniref:DUF6049 family protein n=1 Tax=Varibaculum prostatecancerukia TaxID=2811781 RepID=UPI001C008433|nr:DUF6049 family protein [Varibaculum prostatecancerukia]